MSVILIGLSDLDIWYSGFIKFISHLDNFHVIKNISIDLLSLESSNIYYWYVIEDYRNLNSKEIG